MTTVDLVDETFLAVAPAAVLAEVGDPLRWRQWWPDLSLTVFMDRGSEGIRWNVTGAMVGSCEVWLEAQSGGVLLHYYLRADPAGGAYDLSRGREVRRAARLRDRRARAWKRHVWALKDRLEAGRVPGDPATTGG